jgi:hypothetical protein
MIVKIKAMFGFLNSVLIISVAINICLKGAEIYQVYPVLPHLSAYWAIHSGCRGRKTLHITQS